MPSLLAYVASGIVSGAALASPFVKARSTARTGSTGGGSCGVGLSPEGLNIDGLTWVSSYLSSLFLRCLLGAACADSFV